MKRHLIPGLSLFLYFVSSCFAQEASLTHGKKIGDSSYAVGRAGSLKLSPDGMSVFYTDSRAVTKMDISTGEVTASWKPSRSDVIVLGFDVTDTAVVVFVQPNLQFRGRIAKLVSLELESLKAKAFRNVAPVEAQSLVDMLVAPSGDTYLSTQRAARRIGAKKTIAEQIDGMQAPRFAQIGGRVFALTHKRGEFSALLKELGTNKQVTLFSGRLNTQPPHLFANAELQRLAVVASSFDATKQEMKTLVTIVELDGLRVVAESESSVRVSYSNNLVANGGKAFWTTVFQEDGVKLVRGDWKTGDLKILDASLPDSRGISGSKSGPVVLGALDNRLQVWDADHGTLLNLSQPLIRGNLSWLNWLDDDRALVVSRDPVLVNLKDGESLARWKDVNAFVLDRPDPKTGLFVSGRQGKIYSVRDLDFEISLQGDFQFNMAPTSVFVNSEQNRVKSVGTDGVLREWSTESGKQLAATWLYQAMDGNMMLAGGGDGTGDPKITPQLDAALFPGDVNGDETPGLTKPILDSGAMMSFLFSEDGRQVRYFGRRRLTSVNLTPPYESATYELPVKNASAMGQGAVVTENEERLIFQAIPNVPGAKGAIVCLDFQQLLRGQAQEPLWSIPTNGYVRFSVSQDGKWVLVSKFGMPPQDGGASIYRGNTGQRVWSAGSGGAPIYACDFSPDSEWLLVCRGNSGILETWNLEQLLEE